MNMGFDKETFKKSVVYNVKSLFRKTIDEATPCLLYTSSPIKREEPTVLTTVGDYEKNFIKL